MRHTEKKNYCENDGLCSINAYPNRENIKCKFFENAVHPRWCKYELSCFKQDENGIPRVRFKCTNKNAIEEAMQSAKI